MSTTATTSAQPDPHADPHMGVREYFTIYFALLGLMLLTVLAALFDLGAANFLVAMTIAMVKTVLIVLFFMHVRYSDTLTKVFSAGAFAWLLMMIIGFLNDYFTRGMVAEK
jgi:cytochrome c oxidase subunit 4